MQSPFSLRRYPLYVRIASAAVFAVSALVAVGWVRQNPILVTFVSGYYQQKFNTALCFMLAATVLWLIVTEDAGPVRSWLGRIGAAVLAAFGAATLSQYISGRDLGIDQLMVGDFIDHGPHPGRMSAFTALGFTFVGLALFFMQRKTPALIAFYLTAMTALIWVGIGVAFIYGLPALYRFDLYGGIAIPTIGNFLVLTLGMFLARPRLGPTSLFTGSRIAGLGARRMLPAALIVPTVFGWLMLWSKDMRLLDLRIAATLQSLSIFVLFVALIIWSARSLLKLEEMIATEQREKLRALEKAAHLARYDVLTGLPNRSLFDERLDVAIKYAARRNVRLALLFVDLDRFKPINDTYGHTVGDHVLVDVGRRMAACVRETDTVARQGGDEFVLLLQDVTHISSVSHIAAHLLTMLARPYSVDGHELFLSGSIGIALYPEDGVSPQSLRDNADAAMYYAKSRGRSNYQYFAAHINEHAMRRSAIERQIRSALSDGGFQLHYQPKIQLDNGKLAGLEALVRFKVAGFAPVEFIPVAEESNLIVPLGQWVLREACRQNRQWQQDGHRPVPVSVNVSPLQFKNRNFLQTVRQALEDTGLEACYLDIEITESTAMDDFDHSIATMNALQKLGVSMSIDDFGTGHSSLSYLKRFPINALKIDRSFIQDIRFDTGDAAITRAIIHMAKDLKRKVIAEGVETEDQLDFLRQQDCDQVQGFYFSEALPADAIVESVFSKQAIKRKLAGSRA